MIRQKTGLHNHNARPRQNAGRRRRVIISTETATDGTNHLTEMNRDAGAYDGDRKSPNEITLPENPKGNNPDRYPRPREIDQTKAAAAAADPSYLELN
jgi:hypothetical protein